MNILFLVSIPLISALIGWVTNFFAIKMIFRPHKPFNLFGLKIQGILPRRQSELAIQVGETVEKELISHDDIQNAIDNPEFHKELSSSVVNAIEKGVLKLRNSNPMLAMFLSDEMITSIKGMLGDEVEAEVPAFMEKMFERMESYIDFKELVARKVNEFSLDRLEEIVYEIAAKELKTIELLGAVLGGIVGVVQLGIFALAS